MTRKKTNTFYCYKTYNENFLPNEIRQLKGRLVDKMPELESVLFQLASHPSNNGIFFPNLSRAYQVLKLNLEKNTPPGTLYKLPSYASVHRIIKQREVFTLQVDVPNDNPGNSAKTEYNTINYMITLERMH